MIVSVDVTIHIRPLVRGNAIRMLDLNLAA
jgi:hypothetical protein